MAFLRRASAAALLALIPYSGIAAGPAPSTSRFRGVRGEVPGPTVTSQAVQASLQAALDVVSRGGEGALAQRIAKIEASMWPTFLALPKNSWGRLAPRVVRHLVHSYFEKAHGWLINGLSHHGMQLNATDVHDAHLLKDQAPALVETFLEAQRSGRGLSLGDVVAMAAALERLIFDESIVLLEAAYTLNGHDAADEVDSEALEEVLTSYLLLFRARRHVHLLDADVAEHQALRRNAASRASWLPTLEFERGAVLDFGYARKDRTNPFVPARYSFEAASGIMEGLAEQYGRWQNADCREMKDTLSLLDPDGTGRVALRDFYSSPIMSEYNFTESPAYLRQIGALDEVPGRSPMVRIANYIAGPSNCIATSPYFSVCCLSECHALLNELEGQVQAPEAAPERLLGLAANLSSPSVDAPRQLPRALQAKLRAVAERHGGAVPLHGRLFAQWMHFAFPRECPFPHIAEDAAVLTPKHWRSGGRAIGASWEERQRQIAAPEAPLAPAEVPELLWSDEEVLLLHEPPAGRRALGAAVARLAAQLAALLALAGTALATCRGLATASGGAAGFSKSRDLGLPLPA